MWWLYSYTYHIHIISYHNILSEIFSHGFFSLKLQLCLTSLIQLRCQHSTSGERIHQNDVGPACNTWTLHGNNLWGDAVVLDLKAKTHCGCEGVTNGRKGTMSAMVWSSITAPHGPPLGRCAQYPPSILEALENGKQHLFCRFGLTIWQYLKNWDVLALGKKNRCMSENQWLNNTSNMSCSLLLDTSHAKVCLACT